MNNHQLPGIGPAQSGHVSTKENDFLAHIGKRVRGFRSRRGMTRKQFSQESGISERHIAQVESGDGNISIALLRRMTIALGISLEELFSPESQEPEQKILIQKFLERIPADRLEEVTEKLERDFVEVARRPHLALIGLRGAGKTTLGAKLAGDFKIPFIELDREIEIDAGIPLAEIFSLYGQTGYRRIENGTLKRVVKEQERAVISVGGGVVSEAESYDFLLSHCFTVWVKARPEEHMARVMAQGDFRAMAQNDQAMDDLRRILEAREPLYQKAHMCLDTSGKSVEESYGKLKRTLQANLKAAKSNGEQAKSNVIVARSRTEAAKLK